MSFIDFKQIKSYLSSRRTQVQVPFFLFLIFKSFPNPSLSILSSLYSFLVWSNDFFFLYLSSLWLRKRLLQTTSKACPQMALIDSIIVFFTASSSSKLNSVHLIQFNCHYIVICAINCYCHLLQSLNNYAYFFCISCK